MPQEFGGEWGMVSYSKGPSAYPAIYGIQREANKKKQKQLFFEKDFDA